MGGVEDKLKLKTATDSIMIMDSGFVKALITDAKFSGKVHSTYDIGQLREVLALIKEGTLVVSDNSQTPCIIETESDVVILAPKVDTDRVEETEKAKKPEEKEEDEESK